jgi:autotransporter-associated beta strand protein
VGGSSDFSLAQMTTFLSTASFASGTSFLIDMSNNVTTPQTYAGVISGPQGVVVANLGANVLALNAANTFTGGFTLVAGTVQGNDANSFGANSGTIYLGDTAASSAGVTLQTSRSVTVSNNITLNPGTTGTIEIGGSDANYTCIYSGNIAMNNNLYFNGRKAGSKLSGGTITVGGVGSTPLTLTCSKYGVLDDPIVLANRDLIFNAPDGITSATSGTVTGTGNFTVNYIGNSGSSFTFNAIVNNVGTISNTSPTSVSGNQPITFSGGIGSNVTGIIQNSIKSPTIVSGLLNVASGGTTLTNTSGTKALTISGGVAGTGNLILNNNSATDGGITLTTANVTNAGTITNSGTGTGAVSIDAVIGSSVTGVVQNSGTSQLTLNAANTYAGPTTISAGTLKLGAAGSIAASPTISVAAGGVFDVSSVTGGFQLASGQTLKGGGAVNGAVTVASGSTLQPGSSPGTLSTAGEAWSNGGNYNWMIYNATGTAGAGYSQLAITGTLNLASLTANGFNLNLWSLSGIGPDVNGNALNFNNASPAAWTIATTTAGITGFNADNFSIHTTANNGTGGFSNALAGGSFGLSVTGNNLLLNFTPGSSAHLSTWTGSAGGSWGDSLKWDNDVPNAVGDTATFYNSIAESVDPAVVLLKANRTVSELSFTSTGNRKYQIANDTAEIFSLTLAKTSGAASIAASGTNAHVIDVPVVASSDLTVTQSDTASLTLGDVTTAAGTTMTVTTQSTGTLTVGAISGSGSTSVAGNSHLSASSIVQNTLTIGAGGSVTIRETTAGGAGASPVPEPGTWALLCAGAACLLAFARRRRTAG